MKLTEQYDKGNESMLGHISKTEPDETLAMDVVSSEQSSDYSNCTWSQPDVATDDEVQLDIFEEEVDGRMHGSPSIWNRFSDCFTTPSKIVLCDWIPVTPTANLKLLLKAASPDLRMREAEVNYESTAEFPSRDEAIQGDAGVYPALTTVSDWPEVRRKEKSLGLLCKKFLLKFPLNIQLTAEIKLDDVASFLGVSRRRVYDIINVMEAIDFASRLAKNRYTWHGDVNLSRTIAGLFETAKSENVLEEIKFFIDSDESTAMGCKSLGSLLSSSAPSADIGKKSLTFLSQKFVMMFLVAPQHTLQLDISARVLLGAPVINEQNCGRFKTTIRRLYDIANILTSVNLIQKVQNPVGIRCNKPAFMYIGPFVDGMTRGSDFECRTVGGSSVVGNSANGKCLKKHLSFDQICEVARLERKKLLGHDDLNEDSSKTNTTASSRPHLRSLFRTRSENSVSLVEKSSCHIGGVESCLPLHSYVKQQQQVTDVGVDCQTRKRKAESFPTKRKSFHVYDENCHGSPSETFKFQRMQTADGQRADKIDAENVIPFNETQHQNRMLTPKGNAESVSRTLTAAKTSEANVSNVKVGALVPISQLCYEMESHVLQQQQQQQRGQRQVIFIRRICRDMSNKGNVAA